MKKLIFLAILLSLARSIPCFSQESNKEANMIGMYTHLSQDKQYLKIISIPFGSPAEIAGLKRTDRIYKIDGVEVKDLPDPENSINGEPCTVLKLTIKGFGQSAYKEVSITRQSIPFNDPNYFSEAMITYKVYMRTMSALINKIAWWGRMNEGIKKGEPYYKDPGEMDYSLANDFPNVHYATMAFLHDETRDMHKYKTYDFEYNSTEDPLKEKILFSKLGEQLDKLGMKRSTENPDLVVLMSFFAGKKEQYTPPTQIISTRIKTVYNWYWGVIPVPITETSTQKGFTDVTYMATISLKFLDANEIASSKLPPIVWSGSISQESKNNIILTEKCNDFFSQMLLEFPEVLYQNITSWFSINYTYTGLWYNLKDLRTVGDIIKGSPADKGGLQKGDYLISINGYNIPAEFKEEYYESQKLRKDFSYLFLNINSRLFPYPLKPGNSNLLFEIKRGGKKMVLEIKPEKRYCYQYLVWQ